MDFLDNSGHIFSLQSFYEEPIGYEFEETKYIFWIDSANTNYLSINNYCCVKLQGFFLCFCHVFISSNSNFPSSTV